MRFPPPLRPGDLVAVVAPSSPLPREALFRGIGWLQGRYRLRASSTLLARDGYLAGDDARRAHELSAALSDPDVKAIVAGRGGYGAMRTIERTSLDALARNPRWIIGFSDVTVLHLAAHAVGVASVHGPNVTGLGRASPADRLSWLLALERPECAGHWQSLSVIRGGRARGVAFGGNLSLLHAVAAAGKLEVPRGAVLFLEDVGERPYRVDRMLTSLRSGGHLHHAAAVVLGGFDDCGPAADGVTVEGVLSERTSDLGIPVLAGAPFGHGAVNRAFVLGRDVEVDDDRVTFLAAQE